LLPQTEQHRRRNLTTANHCILITDLFFVPCVAYDMLTRRKIHPAFLYAFVLVILEQAVQPIVISWTPWINLAMTIQRHVA
jgi:hypothetical protein